MAKKRITFYIRFCYFIFIPWDEKQLSCFQQTTFTMTLYSPWNHKVTSTRRNHPVRCNGWHRNCCEHSLHKLDGKLENDLFKAYSFDDGWDGLKEWKEVIQWMIGNLLKQKILSGKLVFPNPLPFFPSLEWMNAVKFHEGCRKEKQQEAARWCRFLALNDFT